jgi:hypothetical protein
MWFMLVIGSWFYMRPSGTNRGKWRIPDGKGESDLFLCSELRGGRLHLCWLRTASVGLCVTNINYVLVHMGFMRSCKLSSFNSHRVG